MLPITCVVVAHSDSDFREGSTCGSAVSGVAKLRTAGSAARSRFCEARRASRDAISASAAELSQVISITASGSTDLLL